MFLRILFLLFCLSSLSAMLLPLTGCARGEPRYTVTGRIHNGGKPLPVKPMVGRLNVLFYPVKEEGGKVVDPQQAVVKDDGTFSVPGTQGNGIPPGKYKIAVTWQDDYPLGPDKLKGAYKLEKTQIVRDVDGEKEIVIDVSNPPTAEEKK